jgi:hypothetical protein
MSSEQSELRVAIANYALEHSINEIPNVYFEKMAKTWHEMNQKGHDWDKYKAAAALLYAAVVDGVIHQSQMTPQGYKALNWAEQYQKKLKAAAATS